MLSHEFAHGILLFSIDIYHSVAFVCTAAIGRERGHNDLNVVVVVVVLYTHIPSWCFYTQFNTCFHLFFLPCLITQIHTLAEFRVCFFLGPGFYTLNSTHIQFVWSSLWFNIAVTIYSAQRSLEMTVECEWACKWSYLRIHIWIAGRGIHLLTFTLELLFPFFNCSPLCLFRRLLLLLLLWNV